MCFKENDKLKQKIKEEYKIVVDKIDNQYPVGVFNDEVKNAKRIFTGGKSAIDLYGIDKENKTFNIFELKAESNVKIGIVSELFFYTCIIRDVIDRKIQRKGTDELEGFNVNAFFLVPRLHPLVTEEVMKLLNKPNNGITYQKLIYKIDGISFVDEKEI